MIIKGGTLFATQIKKWWCCGVCVCVYPQQTPCNCLLFYVVTVPQLSLPDLEHSFALAVSVFRKHNKIIVWCCNSHSNLIAIYLVLFVSFDFFIIYFYYRKDHTTIATLGADNMSYITHNAQTCINDGAFAQYLLFQFVILFSFISNTYNWLDTINIWQRYNLLSLFPNFDLDDKLFWHICNVQLLFPNVVVSPHTLTSLINNVFVHGMTCIRQNQSFLAWPTHAIPLLKLKLNF